MKLKSLSIVLLTTVLAAVPTTTLAGEGEEGRKAIRIAIGGGVDEDCTIMSDEDCTIMSDEDCLMLIGGEHGYLGVALLDLTPELQHHFGSTEDVGVLVSRVEEGSPAERAGLQAGDVITRVDGDAMGGSWEIGKSIRGKGDGDSVRVEVLRDGRTLNFDAAVELRKREVVELGGLLGHDLSQIDLDVGGVVTKALGDAALVLKSPEVHDRLLSLKGLESDLEQRTQELERRLEELERKLQER